MACRLPGLRPARDDDVESGDDRGLEEPSGLSGERPERDELVERARRQDELPVVDRPVVAPQGRCQSQECRSGGRSERQPDNDQPG